MDNKQLIRTKLNIIFSTLSSFKADGLMTQGEFVETFFKGDFSSVALSSWLRGSASPNLDAIIKISGKVGISLESFVRDKSLNVEFETYKKVFEESTKGKPQLPTPQVAAPVAAPTTPVAVPAEAPKKE